MELLVVMLVLSILSTVAIISLMQVKKSACNKIVRYDVKKFFEAEQMYMNEQDDFVGDVGDVISNDSSVSSSVTLNGYSPSSGTIITIINNDPFTVTGTNGGVTRTYACNIETGTITERH